MTRLHEDRALAEAAAEMLKLYAQPQRLMILSCLLAGERTVGEIDAATNIGQPALSQQLAALRGKMVVRTRRQATQIFYALADEKTILCVQCLEAVFATGAHNLPALAAVQTQRPAGVAAFVRMLPPGP